jgi:hypothetical protein
MEGTGWRVAGDDRQLLIAHAGLLRRTLFRSERGNDGLRLAE